MKSKIRVIYKCVLVFILLNMNIFLCFPFASEVKADEQWDVKYEGTVLPENASPAWTLIPSTFKPGSVDRKYRFTDMYSGPSVYFYEAFAHQGVVQLQKAPFVVDDTKNTVVEINALDRNTIYAKNLYPTIQVIGNSTWIKITYDYSTIHIYHKFGVFDYTFTGSLELPHKIRIIKKGTKDFDVLCDGTIIFSGQQMTHNFPASNNGVIFGANDIQATWGDVCFDVNYVYMRNENPPPPPNNPPTLTLYNPVITTLNRDNNTTYSVQGMVTDPDNDNVTVSATIAGVTKQATVTNTKSGQPFTIPFDINGDQLPDGISNVQVIADDGKGGTVSDTSRSIDVQVRLGQNVYILKDTSIYDYPKKTYSDAENDPIMQEQYRFTHDPYYYDNNNGLFTQSNQWITINNTNKLPVTSFSNVGKYVLDYRARDNPKPGSSNFDEFQKWSDIAPNFITFFVHRKPTADFSITTTPNGSNYDCYIHDNSFDIDNISKSNHGISQVQWEWKSSTDSSWTLLPPVNKRSDNLYLMGTMPPNQNYDIALRVRDIDGLNGLGVWSDWANKGFVSVASPPIGFTITPIENPRNSTFTITPNSGVGAYNPKYTIIRNSDNSIVYSGNFTGSWNYSFPSLQTSRDYYTVKQEISSGSLTATDTKTISVYNRAPILSNSTINGLSLSSLVSSPTIINDTTPSLAWTHSDADSDNQKFYRITVKDENDNIVAGTGVNSTNVSTGSPITWTTSILPEGKYSVEFEVNDGYDWNQVKCIKYFEVSLNKPPVAAFTANPNPTDRLTSVHFTSQAYDPDGDPISYQWEFRKQGTTAWTGFDTAANPSFKFPNLGIYEVRQTVTDPKGLSDSVIHNITVQNLNPIADFDLSPSRPYEGDTLIGTDKSYDPEGNDIVIHEWEVLQPDGTTITKNTKDVSITNAQEGTYYFRKRVVDADGNYSNWTAWKSIDVQPLAINGYVEHTPEWNAKRLAYNRNHTYPRPYSWFWAGEKFILRATTTNTGTSTKATRVKVSMSYTDMSTNLSTVDQLNWNGSLSDLSFFNLPNGKIKFTFTATYSNGKIKTDTQTINIQEYWTNFSDIHRTH